MTGVVCLCKWWRSTLLVNQGASKILGFTRNIWPCSWFISGFGDCFFCVPLFEPTSMLSVASTMFYHVPYWLYPLIMDHLQYNQYNIWLVVYLPLCKNMSSSVGMMKFPTEWKNKKWSKPPTRISSISSLLWYHVNVLLTRGSRYRGSRRKRQASERIPVRSEAPWAQSGMILVLILQNDLEMWFNYGFILEMILVLILVSKWGLINFVSY